MAEEGKKRILGPGRHLTTIKRHRQNVKRFEANKGSRAAVRTAIRKVLKAIESKDSQSAKTLFIETQSLMDHAIKRGLYHAKTGHRTISRLNRRLDSIQTS